MVSRFASPTAKAAGHPTMTDMQSTIDNRQFATSVGAPPLRRLGGTHNRSIRDWVSRLLMTPDSRIGWIAPAVRAGLRAIRKRRPSVILSSSPYMSAHLIALLLSRRTRVPWVADFRDPWRDNPFRELGYASLERWDAWLERVVLTRAAHVVCSTPTMTDHLCRRLPFVADKCTTILNGFDAESFYGIEPTRVAPCEDFVLTHCGQFYGSRSPDVWFAALKRVAEWSPKPGRRVHLMLIGPETFDGQPLRELAAAAGVADRVRILGVKTHRETLSYMAGSDALILAGSTGIGSELQVPNKLFEYLAMRKPIIAALSQGNPGISVLKQARAVAHVCPPSDEVGIATAVEKFAAGLYPEVEDPWTGVEQFERSHRAEELAAVFAGEKVSG